MKTDTERIEELELIIAKMGKVFEDIKVQMKNQIELNNKLFEAIKELAKYID
jgi:hypothetical protein